MGLTYGGPHERDKGNLVTSVTRATTANLQNPRCPALVPTEPQPEPILRPRAFFAFAIPFACAALFVRLGVWQLSRLKGKRAFNAMLTQRLAAQPAPVTTLPADTGTGHYRRVSASGTLLYGREVVLAERSHDGAPGVDLLTPMQIAGHDTLVMVNRGWVYSPDAATVTDSLWREADSVTVRGYAETFSGRERPNAGATSRRVHALDRSAVQAVVGMPVAPYVVVQTSDSGSHQDSVPTRLNVPALSEGPHESYAIQWFSFALVAVVGGVALARRSR